MKKYGIIVVLFLMIVVITMVRPEFITPNNLFNVLTKSSIYGIMAIGLTFVIIAKGIDLSVGSVLTLYKSFYSAG